MNTCKSTLSIAAHNGQISALDELINSHNIFFTGGIEGEFRAWDSRSGECIHKSSHHNGGAVNSIQHSLTTETIVTAGADGKLKVPKLS